MRVLARTVCWLVIVVAAFVGIVSLALVVGGDNGDQRLGGAVILVVALGALAGARAGLRAIKRRDTIEDSGELAGLERRLRAGEPIVLRPRTSRRVLLFGFSVAMMITATLFAVAVPTLGVLAIAVPIALLFAFTAIELLPGQGSLRIAPDGLTARTTLRRRHWAWNDVEHFRAYTMQAGYSSTTHIGFDRRDLTPAAAGDVADAEPRDERRGRDAPRQLRRAARGAGRPARRGPRALCDRARDQRIRAGRPRSSPRGSPASRRTACRSSRPRSPPAASPCSSRRRAASEPSRTRASCSAPARRRATRRGGRC